MICFNKLHILGQFRKKGMKIKQIPLFVNYNVLSLYALVGWIVGVWHSFLKGWGEVTLLCSYQSTKYFAQLMIWNISINCTFLDIFGKKVWKSLYLQLTYKKLKKCFAEFYTSFYKCNNKANKIISKNVYQKVHITKVMIRIIISYIEIIGSIPKFPQTLRGAFSYWKWLEIHENSMSSFWYFICIFEKIRFNNNT